MTDRAALVVDGVIQVLYEVSTDALTLGETYTADYIATLEDIDQDNAAVGYRWNGTEYVAPIFADEGLKIDPDISEQIIEVAAETARDIAQQTIADEAATRDRLDQSLQAEIDAVEVDVTALKAITLTAGAGLTGGGNLTANRTFTVGAGTGITVNADDVAITVPVAVANGGTGQTTAAEAIGELIQALTEDTTPDIANDFIGMYDASGDTGSKVTITNAITQAESVIESIIDTLPNLTSIQGLAVTLADAGADAVLGWDDSAGAYENLTASEVRAAAGLGTIATQDANNVSITGGSVTGITDLAVADGGTGLSSTTAYAVLCGGTTSTGALQSIASVGTSGQVLTSNGAGALPTFQAATGGGLTLGSYTSASGTSVDFTGIPATAKMIIMTLVGISTNGGSDLIVQIGNSGGLETTGYSGAGASVLNAASPTVTNASNGFWLESTGGAASVRHGTVILTLADSATNTWTALACIGRSDAARVNWSGGSKALSATLDRISLTTTGGANTFDAGSVNIAYL